jgi:hypothetical protein
MKKFIAFIILVNIAFYINTFDSSLNGSWCLDTGLGKSEELIIFNNDEIIFMDTLYRSTDYVETDGTIYIIEPDGHCYLIQNYLLSKLLFRSYYL